MSTILRRSWKPACAGMALLLGATAAHAESYRVDLIVFLDKYAGGESGRRVESPNLDGAIELGNTAALASAGITLLPESQFALNDEWARLRNAKRYQPLLKLAWVQKDPPTERGPSLRVKAGASITANDPAALASYALSPVDGSIALTVSHYLHLDADLVYTQNAGEGAVSWHLRENRKMKRDELHHLDSPKLGILAKVTKADGSK